MTIGERLREERERMGMSQPKFAALAGTTKQTLFSWESGKTAPDGFQLAALAGAGVDVVYVLTSRREGGGIGESAVHQAVLDASDLLSLNAKVDAQQLARAVVKLCSRNTTPVAPSPARQIFHGDVGNSVNVEGDLKQTGVSFFGRETKKKK